MVPSREISQAGQTSQLRRNGAHQPVRLQNQRFEVRQIAELRRDRARQPGIAANLQPSQTGQGPQLGRKGPRQPVADEVPGRLDPAAEAQPSDPTVLVRLNPEPVPQRRVRQPVGVVGPAVAVGRVVKRLERRTVRRDAVLRHSVGRNRQCGGGKHPGGSSHAQFQGLPTASSSQFGFAGRSIRLA